jgi:hypothetical protein
MKRNREDIVMILDQLRDKKRKLSDSIALWERDLKAFDHEESLSRSRTLPWKMFVEVASKSKKAWKKVD